MEFVARYLRTNGLIHSMFTATSRELLEAQMVPGDPTYGYLLTTLEEEIGARELMERYAVVDGALQEKQPLTIEADPLVFMADGIDACLISVTPVVDCTLRVGTMEVAVTQADPIVELTSDTPQLFAVSLVPMASYWANPITVEAQ